MKGVANLIDRVLILHPNLPLKIGDKLPEFFEARTVIGTWSSVEFDPALPVGAAFKLKFDDERGGRPEASVTIIRKPKTAAAVEDSLFGRVDPDVLTALAAGTSARQSDTDLPTVDAVLQVWQAAVVGTDRRRDDLPASSGTLPAPWSTRSFTRRCLFPDGHAS